MAKKMKVSSWQNFLADYRKKNQTIKGVEVMANAGKNWNHKIFPQIVSDLESSQN